MARLSLEMRRFVLEYAKKGISSVGIQQKLLTDHGLTITRQSVRRFLLKFGTTGVYVNRRRSSGQSKVKPIHVQFIDLWLSENNELTARVLKNRLQQEFDLDISQDYVCRIRKQLGWTAHHVKYCQLINNTNKRVRVQWCRAALARKDSFEDVIFTDESTVEMCSAGRLFFYKPTSQLQRLPSKLPRPKHSYKVHVWAGISHRGRTNICIFTGIMDSVIYQKILQDNFVPFTERVFPDGYRLYQDNDSKHKSASTRKWMEERGMLANVMETPASSPDLNPIENVWSEMKYFLQHEIKPKKKDELVKGIVTFWEQLTAEKCAKYISHIHRVIPQVILNEGAATKF